LSLFSEYLHQFSPKDGWAAAFITAGLGAFAGGWIASRAFTKRAVVAELNALSAIQTLCFSICNRFLALKSQHVLAMKQRYDQLQQEHATILRLPPGPPRQFVFQADFQTLTPLSLPIGELQKMVFEKTSIRGRALVALVDLSSTIEGLNEAIAGRTALSVEIRDRKNKTDDEMVALYFGRRTADGHIDERYRTNLDAIYNQTDDCIFFSKTLATDVVKYGNALRRRHMWKYWLGLPKMQDADWSKANDSGLLPQNSMYEKWLQGFRTLTRWQRIKSMLAP
jgi:hypothetical protein